MALYIRKIIYIRTYAPDVKIRGWGLFENDYLLYYGRNYIECKREFHKNQNTPGSPNQVLWRIAGVSWRARNIKFGWDCDWDC